MKLKVFSLALLLTVFGMAGCDNCGNGELDIEEGEECDDGNIDDGDGCSALCMNETTTDPGSGTGTTTTTPPASSTPSTPAQTASCGNGRIESGEECDGGNDCTADCKLKATPTAVCGNGKKESGEECDDGNKTDGDGCSAKCKKESSTTPPAGDCPNNGDSCTKDICCGGKIYLCEGSAYKESSCESGYSCESFKGEAECVKSCTAAEAADDIYEIQGCDGNTILYSVCEKSDSGNYGITEDWPASGICTDDAVVLTCKSGKEVESDCDNECVATDSMKDYCE